MELRTGIAEEINKHHDIAIARANEAIQHAEQAGKLLLEVKAALPHGQFVAWVEKNIRVSVRQAQRYMAVAQGKPAPIRSLAGKNDTVSHLPKAPHLEKQDAALVPEDLQELFASPTFCPTPGRWHWLSIESGAYWLVPDLQRPDHFHISRFYSSATPLEANEGKAMPQDWDGHSYFDGTKRPVPAWAVEISLQTAFGVDDPAALDWQSKEKPGLSRPFGEPEAAGDH